MDALARAEHAHLLLRQAAALASKGKIQEAEDSGVSGIDKLKERLVI
jgi:hypothetical protein